MRTVGRPARRPHAIRPRQLLHISRLQVDHVYAKFLRRDAVEYREIAEDHRIAVRGPVGVHLISRFVQKGLGLATFGGNKIDLPGLSRRGVEVRDSLAVRRPAGHRRLHWRRRKLQPLAPVNPAPPQHAIREADVGYPSAVSGKIHEFRRYSCKVGDELSRSRVVMHQFAPQLLPDDIELLAIGANHWRKRIHLTRGEPHWLTGGAS